MLGDIPPPPLTLSLVMSLFVGNGNDESNITKRNNDKGNKVIAIVIITEIVAKLLILIIL